MAFNLFSNIFDQFTTKAQPQVPSFSTPQAPRTMNYDPQVNIPQVNTQPTGGVMGATMGATPTPSLRAKVAMSFGLNEKDMKLLDFAKSKGIDQKVAMQFVQDKKKEEQAQAEQAQKESKGILKDSSNRQGIFENVGGSILDFAGGAISEVPNVIGEFGTFANKAMNYNPINLGLTAIQAGFSDKTYGQLRDEQTAEAERIGNIIKGGKGIVQKYGAYDPNTISSKVGETATDIGASLVGPNKVGIFKPGVLGTAGNLALEGGLMGAKYDIATKGEIAPEGVGYGVGGNLIFGAGSKLLGSAYKGVTSKLPASMTLGGLINPGKLDVVKKSLQIDEGIATPEDVGKWILDRVKPGNKQQIAEQLIQHAEKTKGAVDEALASIPTYYKNPEAKKALLQIRNELEGKVGLEGKLAKIDEMLAKPEYTLSELNAVKRELDDMYNLYTKTGDPTAGLKAQGLRNVRADLRSFIEKEAEKYGVNIRKLNNETATARGLADGILRKDSADGVRELLTAFAPSGAGAVVGAGQAIARGEDPLTIIRDALIGGVATKLATSTAVRTRIASALNKLVPKDLTALENYIRSGGKDEIGKKVAEKVIQEGRASPARTITKPTDFAKTPEKAIITPQTMEKGIIQESKQGLSPNIKRPNGNIISNTSNSSNIPVGSKKVQKPSPQVKPVEKRAYNSNLTESELKDATKGAKTREEYNKMAMEAGIKKINAQNEKLYKGKNISYERNGKSYNIEFDKNPDTFLLAKEMVDDAKIPYKIKENTQKIVKPIEKTVKHLTEGKQSATMGDMETKKLIEEARKTRFIEDSKKALQKWSPRKGGYEIKNIKLEDTNVYPAKSRYDTPVYKQYDQYKKSDSVEYWMKRIKEGDTPPPVVVEKRGDKFYVWDGHHRMVAAEESGLKNIDAIVIEKPLEKGNDKKFISFSEKGIENLTKKLEYFYKSKTIK